MFEIPEDFIASACDQASEKLRRAKAPSAPAPSEPAGPLPVVGSGGVVVLRSSSASALLNAIEELRRHMHEPHGGYGGFGDDDTVSREKKMMFHDANKALDVAIVEVRRQMEATNVRQPQDNVKAQP